MLPDIALKTIAGDTEPLSKYDGQVLLIVNVASQCGFTPQYTGLEALWRAHREAGLVVLGFPCDQFGHQEPGTEAEIAEFCSLTYDVTFPMFAKLDVNGPDTHPLYRWLKAERPGVLGSEAIKWNFSKFLVDRDGEVSARYSPSTEPRDLEDAIRTLLTRAPGDAAHT